MRLRLNGESMDKKEIAVLLLSSAVIGALFSAAITAFAQWRERVARQKELILKVSFDLTKLYIDRITSADKSLVPFPDLLLLSTMNQIVTEVFEHGSLSDHNSKKLRNLATIFNDAV